MHFSSCTLTLFIFLAQKNVENLHLPLVHFRFIPIFMGYGYKLEHSKARSNARRSIYIHNQQWSG